MSDKTFPVAHADLMWIVRALHDKADHLSRMGFVDLSERYLLLAYKYDEVLRGWRDAEGIAEDHYVLSESEYRRYQDIAARYFLAKRSHKG